VEAKYDLEKTFQKIKMKIGFINTVEDLEGLP